MTAADPFCRWELEAPVLVRASSNHVYRCFRRGAVVYLRITAQDHRSADEVLAETAWMNSLVEAGLPVVRPLTSGAGRLVEPLLWQGRSAVAICCEAAPGRQADKRRDYTAAVVDSWARLLADLHRHARAYLPDGPQRRPSWDQDRVLQTALAADDAETAFAQRRLRELMSWMRGLATDRDSFGLTHADLHLRNLSVHGAGVATFDFDDACYHWFAHDLAVGLTSIRKAAWEHPDAVDAPALCERFLDGHTRHGLVVGVRLSDVEAFVAYRIALSACWASRSFQIGALDADMVAWYRRSLPWWLGQLAQ